MALPCLPQALLLRHWRVPKEPPALQGLQIQGEAGRAGIQARDWSVGGWIDRGRSDWLWYGRRHQWRRCSIGPGGLASAAGRGGVGGQRIRRWRRDGATKGPRAPLYFSFVSEEPRAHDGEIPGRVDWSSIGTSASHLAQDGFGADFPDDALEVPWPAWTLKTLHPAAPKRASHQRCAASPPPLEFPNQTRAPTPLSTGWPGPAKILSSRMRTGGPSRGLSCFRTATSRATCSRKTDSRADPAKCECGQASLFGWHGTAHYRTTTPRYRLLLVGPAPQHTLLLAGWPAERSEPVD